MTVAELLLDMTAPRPAARPAAKDEGRPRTPEPTGDAGARERVRRSPITADDLL